LFSSTQTPTPIMPHHEVLQIFGNIVQIRTVNSQLLSDLQARLAKWNRFSLVGDIFSDQLMDKILAAYSPFVMQYSDAMDCVHRTSKKSPQFRAFLDGAEKDTRSQGLDLESFLIQPIQRLPRYELLLKDLTKCTDKTHSDYGVLCESAKRVMRVTTQINDKKGEKENVVQIVNLQKKLVGPLTTQIEWDIHHKLIREGEGTCSADHKVTYLFLVNDFLLLTKKKKSAHEVRGIVPLADVSVEADTHAEEINLKLPNSDPVVIKVPTATKMWYSDVRHSAEQYKIKNGGSVKGLSLSTSALVLSPKKSLKTMLKMSK